MNFVDVSNQPGRRSIIWKYVWFDKLSENSECQLCKKKGVSKIIYTKGGCTKTALDHLKFIHHIDGKNGDKVIKESNVFEIRETVQEACAKLNAVDRIPFRTIAQSEMLQKFGNNYQFASDKKTGKPKPWPKSHNTVRKYTFEHATEIESKIIKSLDVKIRSGDRMALTLDEWSSKGFKKYLNVNAHHRDDPFDCLGLSRCLGSLPAPKLTQLVVDHANRFGLDLNRDVVSITTDGASVMHVFGRSIPCLHLTCQCHAVNLAVRDILYPAKKKKDSTISSTFAEADTQDETLEEVSDSNFGRVLEHDEQEGLEEPELLISFWLNLVENARGIVSLFRKSPVKNEEFLQEFVMQSQGKELTLILDCKTRWNTLAAMLERFLMLYDDICMAVLKMKKPWPFNEADKLSLIQLKDALKSMELAIKKLGNRGTNLLSAEVIYKFVEDQLTSQGTDISLKLREAFKRRVMERRNATLVHLMLFLKNPAFWTKEKDRFGVEIVQDDIIELAKSLIHR